MKCIILAVTIAALAAPAAQAHELRSHHWTYVTPAPGTRRNCGIVQPCPTRPYGHLSLATGQEAIRDELRGESYPTSVAVGQCAQRGRTVRCDVEIGPASYGPLGCAPDTPCDPALFSPGETMTLLARRVASDEILVWYGPGRPVGVQYIVYL